VTNVSTSELVSAAAGNQQAVAAFNVITLEHAEAVLCGAEQAGFPVILQVSENAIRYHGGNPAPLIAACAALIAASSAPASLHLDHITDVDILAFAQPGYGVSSAMFDASDLPYLANVERTRAVVDELHQRGCWVEAELGAIGGKGGAHQPGVRTDPSEAADFVASTGVDALAVAVGSSHAMTRQTAELDVALLSRIAAMTPVPLVLHGSSGVPIEQLRCATEAGIAKIKIGTALNVAFTGAVRDVLSEQPDLTDPRRYLGPARSAVASAVADLLTSLSAYRGWWPASPRSSAGGGRQVGAHRLTTGSGLSGRP
jgi:fructose-bisphosphate aldolase, class II